MPQYRARSKLSGSANHHHRVTHPSIKEPRKLITTDDIIQFYFLIDEEPVWSSKDYNYKLIPNDQMLQVWSHIYPWSPTGSKKQPLEWQSYQYYLPTVAVTVWQSMMFLPNYCVIMLVGTYAMVSVKCHTYCRNIMCINIGTHWKYKHPNMLITPSEMIYNIHLPKYVKNIRNICFHWQEIYTQTSYSVYCVRQISVYVFPKCNHFCNLINFIKSCVNTDKFDVFNMYGTCHKPL